MKWGWVKTALVIFAGAGAGFLVAFLMITYWPHKVYVLEESKQAYDIVTDLTTIIITIVAVIAALSGIVIGLLLHRTLYSELSEKLTSKIQECTNIIFANLHKATSSLWGQLYEQFLDKPDLIKQAVEEGKKAVSYANEIDENEYWEDKLEAINNYLMSLGGEGGTQNRDEVYRNLANLERILKERKHNLDIIGYQGYLETIYFIHWRYPLHSGDKEKAEKDFYLLEGHPGFNYWMQRWKNLGLRPPTHN